jgi:hypothetical protein
MALSERLHPDTYSNDEPVGIAGVPTHELPGPLAAERWKYISQQMWHRLLGVGRAYDLHFAEVIDPIVDTVLDSIQCDSLDEELRFIMGVVHDGALNAAITVVLDQVDKVRGRSGMALVLSPP